MTIICLNLDENDKCQDFKPKSYYTGGMTKSITVVIFINLRIYYYIDLFVFIVKV